MVKISSIEEVTPALHGIVENLTISAIVKRWNVCVQPVLNGEDEIFTKVCATIIPLGKEMHIGKSATYKAFEALLVVWLSKNGYEIEVDGLELNAQESGVISTRRECLRGLFNLYWEVYDCYRYTSDSGYDALQLHWQQRYRDAIQNTWNHLLSLGSSD